MNFPVDLSPLRRKFVFISLVSTSWVCLACCCVNISNILDCICNDTSNFGNIIIVVITVKEKKGYV